MIYTQTNITVQVQPNARRNEVVGFEGDILHIKIKAPPVKGKANSELIDFLSEILGITKASIRIEKGLTSRRKLISIKGLGQAQTLERLLNQKRE